MGLERRRKTSRVRKASFWRQSRAVLEMVGTGLALGGSKSTSGSCIEEGCEKEGKVVKGRARRSAKEVFRCVFWTNRLVLLTYSLTCDWLESFPI